MNSTATSSTRLIQNEIYPTSSLDLDNRDPIGINKHLQFDFVNVIAEPDTSAHNIQTLYEISKQVYYYSKIFIYRFLTILLGLPLMVCWGLLIGTYTFTMIWILAPIRRLSQSFVSELGFYIQSVSDAVISPLYRSVGSIYSGIHVSLDKHHVTSTQTIEI